MFKQIHKYLSFRFFLLGEGRTMGNEITSDGKPEFAAATHGARMTGFMKSSVRKLIYFISGLAVLFLVWWLGIYLVASNPATEHFADFGPIPAFDALSLLWEEGVVQSAITSSGYRLGLGLLIAIAIGAPIGVLMGRSKRFQELSNSPFQLLRMISPLSWEPIAVIVWPTWDQAIVFLIAIASMWPIAFATAAGLAKVDPAWFKVARNLGATPMQLVTQVIVPAITFDVLTGIRLALGVAWIVLVPAEFLGVTSGLGYSIEDARETLSYDHLMAMVLVIGAIGYILDSSCVVLIKRYSWHRGEV
jgi:NitT/TauT family transport system permease protein